MVHLLQPGQPLKRWIVFASASNFSRRTNPRTVGVHPQTDQQLRIDRRTPAFLRATLDALIEPRPIQTPYQQPNRARRMVLANQPLDIHRAPTHLLSVYETNQRLLARRIFFAHAPRIA